MACPLDTRAKFPRNHEDRELADGSRQYPVEADELTHFPDTFAQRWVVQQDAEGAAHRTARRGDSIVGRPALLIELVALNIRHSLHITIISERLSTLAP